MYFDTIRRIQGAAEKLSFKVSAQIVHTARIFVFLFLVLPPFNFSRFLLSDKNISGMPRASFKHVQKESKRTSK